MCATRNAEGAYLPSISTSRTLDLLTSSTRQISYFDSSKISTCRTHTHPHTLEHSHPKTLAQSLGHRQEAWVMLRRRHSAVIQPTRKREEHVRRNKRTCRCRKKINHAGMLVVYAYIRHRFGDRTANNLGRITLHTLTDVQLAQETEVGQGRDHTGKRLPTLQLYCQANLPRKPVRQTPFS